MLLSQEIIQIWSRTSCQNLLEGWISHLAGERVGIPQEDLQSITEGR